MISKVCQVTLSQLREIPQTIQKHFRCGCIAMENALIIDDLNQHSHIFTIIYHFLFTIFTHSKCTNALISLTVMVQVLSTQLVVTGRINHPQCTMDGWYDPQMVGVWLWILPHELLVKKRVLL